MNCNMGGKQVNISLGVNLSIGLSLLLATAAFADTKPTTVLFQPPPEEEQPEETEGAASRQDKVCSQDLMASQKSARLKLTAVVPEGNYGLTVAERPTFWVYLPQTSAQQVILSIKAQDNPPHWQQSIELTGESGMMGIKLSDAAPALETGKNYQWAVTLVCGSRPHPNDPVVTAWIRRVAKSNVVGSQQRETSQIEQAKMYARQGVWYDTLDILISEQESSIANWREVLNTYLQSGGLIEIADEPVIKF